MWDGAQCPGLGSQRRTRQCSDFPFSLIKTEGDNLVKKKKKIKIQQDQNWKKKVKQKNGAFLFIIEPLLADSVADLNRTPTRVPFTKLL